jgi:DNA ligase-1
MLAKPTKAITEVLDRFEGKEFTCEYKYDGERAQVHMMEGGEIAVFSRNSENMSAKYPDLVEQIPRVSGRPSRWQQSLMTVYQRGSQELCHRRRSCGL